MTDRKKPGVAFWATAALVVVLVVYPLSFGPACWMADSNPIIRRPVLKVYYPLILAASRVSSPALNALYRWGRLRSPFDDEIPVALQMMIDALEVR